MEKIIRRSEYVAACEVHAQILNSAKAAQENLYQMAMGFKRMRDEKLYFQLGYGNFGDYCEAEIGMKRASVYHYITIAERLPEDFVYSNIQIGKAKLYLLTTVSEEERTEIAETVDLESTTVKELKAEIANLKSDKSKADEELKEQREKAIAMGRKNIEFVEKIKELESRPVEVAVKDNSDELNKLRTKFELEIGDKNQKISSLEQQLAKQNEAADTDVYGCFKAYISNVNDAWNRMLGYVSKLGRYEKNECLNLAGQAIGCMNQDISKIKEN